MRPRLVHIARSLDVGGVESQILSTLPRLQREFKVSLVCLHEKGQLAEQLEREGIPVTVERFRNRWTPASLWRLARYLRRERVDIVQTHMYGPNISGIAAAGLAGVPVRISTVHNMDQWRSPRRIRTDRAVLRWRDAVFCVSEPVRRVYMERTGCPAGKCRVLPNGVDLESFRHLRSRDDVLEELNIPPGSRVVGVVARLVPAKDIRLFLDTADRIRREQSDVFFLVVGEGPLREDLQDHASRLGLSDHVVFTGLRHDVPDLVSAMDCFLLTSKAEGFAIVVLESMAAGVPVVGTRVGGVEDIIRSPEEGFLVAPGDGEELTKAVLRVLGDSSLAETLKVKGRQRARDFRIEAVVEDLSRAYRELLEVHGGGRRGREGGPVTSPS